MKILLLGLSALSVSTSAFAIDYKTNCAVNNYNGQGIPYETTFEHSISALIEKNKTDGYPVLITTSFNSLRTNSSAVVCVTSSK